MEVRGGGRKELVGVRSFLGVLKGEDMWRNGWKSGRVVGCRKGGKSMGGLREVEGFVKGS